MIITCPHCNNQFSVVKGLLKEYTYKINGVYFCSYKCWRANGGGKVRQPKMSFKNLAEMEKYLRQWQHILCLDHWYIEPKLEDEIISDGVECWGLNTHEQVNRVATISVRKYKAERDDTAPKKYCAEQILVHELLHCHYNWLQKDYKDHAAAYYDVKDHQQLELMAEALILAKYNLKRDFFYNKKKD